MVTVRTATYPDEVIGVRSQTGAEIVSGPAVVLGQVCVVFSQRWQRDQISRSLPVTASMGYNT